MSQGHEPAAGKSDPAPIAGLRWRVAVTGAIIFWEGFWRIAWRPASALALFLSLSLFDVWRLLPVSVHYLTLLALLIFGAVIFAQGFSQLRFPDRRTILIRLERDNALAHHPLLALEDRQESGMESADARMLWRMHLARILRRLPPLRLKPPQPQVIQADIYGLRLIAGILLVAGVFTAGPHAFSRLMAGFTPLGFAPLNAARLEVWITPPAYTGKAPILLAGQALQQAGPANTEGEPVRVPAGSELSLRFYGGQPAELIMDADAWRKRRLPLQKIDSANQQLSVKLDHDQSLSFSQRGAASRNWRIKIIPDQPPVISLLEDISVTRQYALNIRFAAADDYGLASAAVEITPAADTSSPQPPPLKIALPLPRKGKDASQTAYADLTEHPWAGSRVNVRLTATDSADQTGFSAPVQIVLPQRPFHQPLARALMELRGKVLTTPDEDGRTIAALDALSLYPEQFTKEYPLYLGLRVARHRLSLAGRDAQARSSVIGLLWALALRLEDDGAPLAGDALRQLQNALREALAGGASDEEIAGLMQQLREAMQDYLRGLAAQADGNTEDGAPVPQPENDKAQNQTLRMEDLEEMLRQIERLNKSGAREAAQDLLAQLQNILENLRAENQNGAENPRQKAMGGALRDLTDMLREQQQLQDETSRQRQQGAGKTGNLAKEQEALRGKLEGAMRKLGEGAEGESPQALGRAEQAMREAAGALKKGEAGSALEPQSQSIGQLRAGAGAIARMLREEAAKNQAARGDGNGAAPSERDPLGRGMGNDPNGAAAIPQQFDIERALHIRRELELRASQRRRPAEELDYIGRLLKLF